eukprot:332357_1
MTIVSTLESNGYTKNEKITNTLQGSIWHSIQKSTNTRVVIKVTDRYLHKNGMIVHKERAIPVHENIKKEMSILKRLSKRKPSTQYMTKYVDWFKSKQHYALVMEDGGHSLFKFILKVHRFISKGIIEMEEWHRLAKIIFKQMIECIAYIHSHNVCHFDISLENFLITEVEVLVADDTRKMHFCTDGIQIRLCDFGLAEAFPKGSNFESNKYCGKPNYKSPEVTRYSSQKRRFSAKSNDVWCLGVSFFMMMIGSAPWKKAVKYDPRFVEIMKGDVAGLLSAWNRLHYVNHEILELFSLFFKSERKRVDIDTLKESEWCYSTS